MTSESTDQDQPTPKAAPGACIGGGRLQWNGGAWFGAQLGSTLWLGLVGAVFIAHDLTLGLRLIGLCLAANIVGLLLWRSRRTLAPHPAIQLLCLAALIAAAAVTALIEQAGLTQTTLDCHSGGLTLPIWAYLAIYPILMAQLAFLNSRKRS